MSRRPSLSLFLLLSLLVLAGGCQPLTRTTSFAETEPYVWNRLDLEAPACADGSDWAAYSRKGGEDRLLLHFAGGGACWDDDTCGHPFGSRGDESWYLDRLYPGVLPHGLAGLFDAGAAENPFAGWHVIFLPYCSGDLHLGRSTRDYLNDRGRPITVEHRGAEQVEAALAWAAAELGPLDQVLLSGESAGGFAVSVWAPSVAARWPDTPLTALIDGASMTTGRWGELTTQWEADLPGRFGVEPGQDLVADALRAHRAAGFDAPVLHYSTTRDGVLAAFQGALEDTPNEERVDLWAADFARSAGALAEDIDDYHYFVSDWSESGGRTPHTALTGDRVFEVEEGERRLIDWLRAAVIEGNPSSVGSEFLTEP